MEIRSHCFLFFAISFHTLLGRIKKALTSNTQITFIAQAMINHNAKR